MSTCKETIRKFCLLSFTAVLCCFLALFPGSSAQAREEKSLIFREADKNNVPWIVEMRTSGAPDSGTAQSAYMQLFYTAYDKKGNPYQKKADAQIISNGISNFYSNHTGGKNFTYALTGIEPAHTYYLVFKVPKEVTSIDNIHISIDPVKNQAYDNLRIDYLKVFRMDSGSIGDLTRDTGGNLYRTFGKLNTISYYSHSAYANNTQADTALNALAGSTNPGEVIIPVTKGYSDSDLLLNQRSYFLRLTTREEGDFDGNLRIFIYAKSREMAVDEVAATIDLDSAAIAQGKTSIAHDLYGNSILEIPFRSGELSYYYPITRVVVQPLGKTGTSWYPDSIVIFGKESGGSAEDYTVAHATPSMPNFYNTTREDSWSYGWSRILAFWENDDNVAFNSGSLTELRKDGTEQPGCRLHTPSNANACFLNRTSNNYYLLFQTRDMLDSGLGLNPVTDTSKDLGSSNSQLTDVYLDITYKAKQPSLDSLFIRDYGDIFSSTRTMRYYLAEGAWQALSRRGINATYAYNTLFSKGQSDYLPITLLDMATGTADDIISVTLTNKGIDSSWELNSFAIYEGEPAITNADTINNLTNGGDNYNALHADIAFREYPKLYYAPAGGIRLLKGDSLVMRSGDRQQLVKPGENLTGYLNDGNNLYHPYEPCINYSNTYLFVIQPSAVAGTNTSSDLEITVSYLDNRGLKQNTTYQLDGKLEEFYGKRNYVLKGTYLPQNMHREIQFLMNLNDVRTFQSVTITMKNINETFQFDTVSIYKVKDVDNQVYSFFKIRQFAQLSSTNIGPETFDLVYLDRYTDRGDLMAKVTKTTYLANSSTSKTLNFIDYSTGEPLDQAPSSNQGLTSIKNQMAYDEINQDLKLALARSTYEIQVNVSPVADAGSGNYFFFQLVFENGTSGVVLANDQIAGDAFRPGETSSFSIMTNQYYGAPKGIRIYTHSSNTEDTTSFDKLKIDSINIIRQSGIGLSTSWVIENIGWIDINYTEEDISGLTTQMNSESSGGANFTSVCREYYVTKNAAAMDFMVEFEVCRDTEIGDPNLTALVSYRQTTGANSTISLNVNELVDDFNGVPWAAYLPGQMSRFYMSLNDVASISQIRFQTDRTEKFRLKNLKIYRVSNAGDVYLDAFGRYNREGDLTPITYGAMDTPISVDIANAGIINLATNQNMNVTFQTDSDGTTSFTSGATTQTNVSETLNIYVFPGTNTTFRAKLMGALRYTGTYSSGYMQKSLTFEPSNMIDGVMVLRDVKINNLGSITSLTLSSDDNRNPSVSHVIIERVNNKRKEKTYFIDFADYYLISPVQAYADSEEGLDEMKQTVTITTRQLDPIRLSKTNDIGVALRYRSSIDGSVEYLSDYVYLSEQAKNSLSMGEPVTATLYEHNVGEIIGVSIIATGNVNLATDTVYVCNYNQHDELLYATGISDPLTINSQTGNINHAEYYNTTQQNPSTVMPVIFTLKTAEDTALVPVTGTHSNVYGTLVCKDPNDGNRTVEISLGNIRDYFSRSNQDYVDVFQAGRTDTFTAYLYNTGEPLALKLTMDSDDNDPWTLAEVAVRRKLPDGTYEARSGAGAIVSADGTTVIDLKALSAMEQINMQQPQQPGTDQPTEPTPDEPVQGPSSEPTVSGNDPAAEN